MMSDKPALYDNPGSKKSLNVSINKDLIVKAKALGINLSKTLETRLLELIKEHERANWVKENETAINEYNERIERSGEFSKGVRRF